MTWVGTIFQVGQELHDTALNAVNDDITAQANGDTGAPKQQVGSYATGSITAAKIAASAVVRSKLATALTSTSGSLSVGENVGIILSRNAFFPMIYVSAQRTTWRPHLSDGGSGSSPRFSLTAVTAEASYEVAYRYVTTGS